MALLTRIGAAALLLWGLEAAPAAAQVRESVGTVVRTAPEVKWRLGKGPQEDLKDKASAFVGMEIKTFANAGARIVLNRDLQQRGTVILGSKTTVELTERLVNEAGGLVKMSWLVKLGQFRLFLFPPPPGAPPREGEYMIRTPGPDGTEIRLQGTDVAVQVDKNATTTIWVMEGEVTVTTAAGGVIQVPAGYSTRVRPGREPEPLARIRPDCWTGARPPAAPWREDLLRSSTPGPPGDPSRPSFLEPCGGPMRKLLIFALSLALAIAALGAELPFPATEFFPVEPEVNAERGSAVAVDAAWLAVGAPRDDRDPDDPDDPDDPERKDAGAVYLFHWSGTAWDQKAKLFADQPRQGAHFGFSLAMRNGILAVGALGEGAVYTFALQGDGVWTPTGARLTGSPRVFGRSLALDGNRLAVGAVGGHGAADGAVYLYHRTNGSWVFWRKVEPRARQKGERFGSAVALASDVLVAGAPGSDTGAGAVYVFRRRGNSWREEQKLRPPDGPRLAGGQLGAAVATNGEEIFAGAPTSDLAGPNSGAVYRFVQSDGDWDRQRLEVEAAPGDQLGASLALSADLFVVGAPTPPPGVGTGKVHVLRRSSRSWEEPLAPGNTETRDLDGFAVAVDGKRVVVGGALGDQGAGAAGAAWSFGCPDDKACSEEAEAVARDDLSGRRFGVSVALTKDLMAVGAPESDVSVKGVVYLYRQTRGGWRQEKRLSSGYPGDGFGSSVALEGSLLAVGAPLARSAAAFGKAIDHPNGSVDLFVRSGSSWAFEATLPPPADVTAFGTSVAIADGVVAVGAPGSSAVCLFQKGPKGWAEAEVEVVTFPAEGFGAAVSLRGGVLAIGAPGAKDGSGAVYVSVREEKGWTQPQPLPDPRQHRAVGEIEARAARPRALGSSVAVGDGIIAAGAPGWRGGDGAVFLFRKEKTSWTAMRRRMADDTPDFGAAVALLGNRLVAVGAGATVALSQDFIVVTSPGRSAREEPVTMFELPAAAGGSQ